MKSVVVDLCFTVLENVKGIRQVVRHFSSGYHRDNGILSFDELVGDRWVRRHYRAEDVLSVCPRVAGVDNGRTVDRVFTFDIDRSYDGTEETFPAAAEPEEDYGYS